jgi:hypothetical protein
MEIYPDGKVVFSILDGEESFSGTGTFKNSKKPAPR